MDTPHRVARLQRAGRRLSYPWSDLRVGDWFDVVCPAGEIGRARESLKVARRNWQRGRSEPVRFRTRTLALGGAGNLGIRVWRVA